jgi:hypothetical protein
MQRTGMHPKAGKYVNVAWLANVLSYVRRRSAAPGAWGGVVAVQIVGPHVTFGTAFVSRSMARPMSAGSKPIPVTVITSPPAAEPELGVIPVIWGGSGMSGVGGEDWRPPTETVTAMLVEDKR